MRAPSSKTRSSDLDGREASRSYIIMVQCLIERCLLMRLDRDQSILALAKHAHVQPAITAVVWQELEKTNQEFFAAYRHHLRQGGQHYQQPLRPQVHAQPSSPQDDGRPQCRGHVADMCSCTAAAQSPPLAGAPTPSASGHQKPEQQRRRFELEQHFSPSTNSTCQEHQQHRMSARSALQPTMSVGILQAWPADGSVQEHASDSSSDSS